MASSSETPSTVANTPWWADKSFLLVVVGVIVSLLNRRFSLGLDAGEIAAMLATVIAFVVGNKWKSGAITVAEIKATNALDIAAEVKNATPEQAARLLGTLTASAAPTKPNPPGTRP